MDLVGEDQEIEMALAHPLQHHTGMCFPQGMPSARDRGTSVGTMRLRTPLSLQNTVIPSQCITPGGHVVVLMLYTFIFYMVYTFVLAHGKESGPEIISV